MGDLTQYLLFIPGASIFLALNQYMISISVYALRMWRKIDIQDFQNYNEWISGKNESLANKKDEKDFFWCVPSFKWIYFPLSLLSITAIVFIINLMIFKNHLWGFLIYDLIFLIDVIILFKIDRKTLLEFRIDALAGVFPEIVYPKRILNAIFSPIWLILWVFILAVVIVIAQKII